MCAEKPVFHLTAILHFIGLNARLNENSKNYQFDAVVSFVIENIDLNDSLRL